MKTSAQTQFLAGLRRTACLYATVAVLGVTSTVSIAYAEDFVAIENDGRRGHWSATEFMAARDLDVPQPDMSLEELLEQAEEEFDFFTDEEPVSADGAYPVEEDVIDPELDFAVHSEMETVDDEFAADDLIEPQDVGTFGAYFSSSRLIPTDARLYYPYSTVGKLFFTIPNQGRFICSAAVLRPRIILTAGHCVHRGSGGANGFYTNFLFVPAYHNGQAPYQIWDWSYVVVTGEWANSNGAVPNSADFAIIELRDRNIGNRVRRIGEVTGYLGYRTHALRPNHTKKLGYPGNHDRGLIMHQVDSEHHATAPAGTVLYGSDMRGGSSGGPWVENFGEPAAGQTGGLRFYLNRIVGVTSYGYVSQGPKVQGSSVLNGAFLGILNLACNHRAGNC